ncbi:Arc-like DNA binding domain-containing protein [Rosenbergiella nectarea]|uniref:Arc-like DNA binding domain-containing protein n=1 Tax=Rosenbergiella nectarea TaxID=988801 RepID=A0A1H9EPM4_9GAMM|nr:Arc family DNA-binding protein [Rosenbergiella nectarea]SEQ27661.1 Arc-like DNA binding domain-containing protein [Rosenbergiella nectarea]
MSDSKIRDIAPTGIRFPEWLKAALKKAATDECRSFNGEVIKRLERSLREDGFIKA